MDGLDHRHHYYDGWSDESDDRDGLFGDYFYGARTTANIRETLLLEESPTCRLFKSIHNRDLAGIKSAISDGARVIDTIEKGNVLEYAVSKTVTRYMLGDPKGIKICVYLIENYHSDLLTTQCAKKIMQTGNGTLLDVMIGTLQKSNLDFCERLLSLIDITEGSFSLARVFTVQKEYYHNEFSQRYVDLLKTTNDLHGVWHGWNGRSYGEFAIKYGNVWYEKQNYEPECNVSERNDVGKNLANEMKRLGLQESYFDDNGFGYVPLVDDKIEKKMLKFKQATTFNVHQGSFIWTTRSKTTFSPFFRVVQLC